jgi:hypothetical protein
LLEGTQIKLRLELFRRNIKVYSYAVIKTDMIYAYLDYNTVAIQKILMVISLLLQKMLGKRTPLPHFGNYINIITCMSDYRRGLNW